MKEFYLYDSPSFKRLKNLRQDYPELDPNSVMLYLELQKTYKLMKEKHDNLMQQYEISDAKFTIMMLLTKEQDMTLAPSQLSKKIGSKKSTITGILKGMENKGLIQRKLYEEDKRTNYVQLTKEGLTVLKKVLPENYELVSSMFETFTSEEKETFYHLISKLKNKLLKDEENEEEN